MDFFNRDIYMILKKFISDGKQRLSKLLEQNLTIGYSAIQKIIRNKDVKVNGKRVSSDMNLNCGDEIFVYFREDKIIIVYEDDDIVVAYKPIKIETVNDRGDDLRSKLSSQIGVDVFAVHRLDRNTEGLVIFAKNLKAKNDLDESIKNRKIEKFYLTKVIGVPKEEGENLIAYHKKDEKSSLVYISDRWQSGYEQIITRYKVIEKLDDFSILEVELVTGKTHQIRAHLSHVGLPILGDEKYGLSKVNKKYNKKFQCLCAYKLVLDFDENKYLSRLSGLKIELDKKDISFFKI